MEGICEGECMERCPGYEPLTLIRCQSCELPQLYKPSPTFSFTNLLLSFNGMMRADPAVAGTGINKYIK